MKKQKDKKMIGVARPIDILGRITLPKEMRDMLNVKTGDMLCASVRIEDDKPIIVLETNPLLLRNIQSLKTEIQHYCEIGKISSDKKSDYCNMLDELQKIIE